MSGRGAVATLICSRSSHRCQGEGHYHPDLLQTRPSVLVKGEANAKPVATKTVQPLALRTIEREHMRDGVDSLNSEEILKPSPRRIKCPLDWIISQTLRRASSLPQVVRAEEREGQEEEERSVVGCDTEISPPTLSCGRTV